MRRKVVPHVVLCDTCTVNDRKCYLYGHMRVRQIGPIVDKQTVRRHLDTYEEEEYLDRSGPDLYRAMRDYPRTGSGD